MFALLLAAVRRRPLRRNAAEYGVAFSVIADAERKPLESVVESECLEQELSIKVRLGPITGLFWTQSPRTPRTDP